MSEGGKLELQSHSAHPEPQPRQRLEKPGAIIEYANARGPLAVGLGVALDEIRAEALIWDTDGRRNRRVHKVQGRAGRVRTRLLPARKGARETSRETHCRSRMTRRCFRRRTRRATAVAFCSVIHGGCKRDVFLGVSYRWTAIWSC